MAFELAYPAGSGGGSPTEQWLPSVEPLINGSDWDDDGGVMVDVLADQATLVADKIASAFQEYTYVFEDLTSSDLSDLTDFRDAVLGAAFDQLDATMGSTYRKVKFATLRFKVKRGKTDGRFDVTILLRSQP